MKRITDAYLADLVLRINEATGSPTQPWTEINGRHCPNVGHYHVDSAYGGVALDRMVNPAGAVKRISPQGFGTKRQLADWMEAFLRGLGAGK